MIRYRIELHDLHAHQYRVTLTVPRPAAEQRLSLPVWIPGSYMVREFGRHLSHLQARQGSRAVKLVQLDKTTWQVHCAGAGVLTVSYLVYAFDTSVRTAFLNVERGFFNGTSLCLRVHGREQQSHAIGFGALPRGWQVATAMRQDGKAKGKGKAYEAANYDELVDHPFELGAFWRGEFKAHGVSHQFVVAGAWPTFDGDRLLADAKRICETHIVFWHGDKKPKPPFERYVFMLHATDDNYGGLEHRASTALIAARKDLPHVSVAGLTEGYVTLLGLISHEYFHTWNVKRLRPAEFAQIDYMRENYTPLLWFFEGFTSYYDDLLLLRAGLIDVPRYLSLVAKTMSGVAATPGRTVQSVAQASFDAWVKYYRQDENTANATVSYYTKGALVALAFDATLRAESNKKPASLDDVMRHLWRTSQGGPITEAQIAEAFAVVGGHSFARELKAWVHGTDDLPLPKLLAALGVDHQSTTLSLSAQLGLRLNEAPGSGVQVKAVSAGSAAVQAGVAAGDELLAVNGWRIRRLDDAVQWLRPGAAFELMLARDQRVQTVTVQPTTASHSSGLALSPRPVAAVAKRRRAWLGI